MSKIFMPYVHWKKQASSTHCHYERLMVDLLNAAVFLELTMYLPGRRVGVSRRCVEVVTRLYQL